MATSTRSPADAAEDRPDARSSTPPDEPPRGPHLGPYPVQLPKLSDPRLHVATVTTTLQVLGQTVFAFNLSIAQILLSIGTCAAIDGVITFRRSRVIAWPASAMLTGNGIALIMRVPGTEHGDWWSLHGWWVFVGTAVLAMASKHLIRVGGRHVFNPSNLALVVVFVALGEARADPQVLWWGPLSAGLVIAFVVILGGSVAITRRVGQGHSAVSFWAVFAAAVAVIAASGHSITANWHVGPISGWDYWVLLVTSPEVLVFVFYMITDPKTAPGGRVSQTVYGTSIALVAALVVSLSTGEFATKVGILAGLVVLCPFVRLIERRSPAPRSADDTVRSWLPTVLSPPRLAGASRALWSLGAAAAVVGTAVLLGVLGSASGEPSSAVDLTRRDEVAFDVASLPEVDVEPGAPGSAVTVDAALAQQMAVDVAHGLEIEAAAIERADADLAAAALSGVRLEQARAAIAAGAPPVQRRIDALVATVVRVDDGPQTPPELAVRVAGTLGGAGSSERFESTFTLTSVGGVHLISNEYGADGEPVGDQHQLRADAIEAPVAADPTAATADQLEGRSLRDVTAEVGLDVARAASPQREGPAALGGGVAVGDVTGNGFDDVFLTRAGRPNALYRNDGDRFVDITDASGLPTDPDQTSTAATLVDVDGDGHLDLVVLGLGDPQVQLHLGRGDGTFVAATEQWGLPSDAPADPDAAMLGIAAADIDRDGNVDLVLTEADPYHVRQVLEGAGIRSAGSCSPAAHAARADAPTRPSRTRLLRNTGSRFVDATDRLGIDPSRLVAMTPRFVDLDGDGWDDLVIAGQGCTTVVLRNDRAGGFVDVTAGSGLDAVDWAAGIELVDLDGDGLHDLFLTGLSYPTSSGDCPLVDPLLGCGGNRLLRNDGDFTFTDVTDQHGVRDARWAFGAAAVDLTSSGSTDLFVANGLRSAATENAAARTDGPLHLHGADTTGALFVDTGAGARPDAVGLLGADAVANAKAVVPFDYDGDGRLDLLVVGTDGAPALYRNESEAGAWATVRLSDPTTSNRHGVGALVTANLDDGRTLVRRVGVDGSFQSGRPGGVHLGLGGAAVDELVVRWPDGGSQRLTDLPTGRPTLVERAVG